MNDNNGKKREEWRLIRFSEDCSVMQMAIDEAIAISCSEQKSPPTLRFYSFKPYGISIGYGQRASNFNIEEIRNKSFDIVRRMSGGTAVLHKNDLVYSLILPEEILPHKIVDAYNYLSDGLVQGLRYLNLKAEKRNTESIIKKDSCYLNSNPYDVVINNKKISGNAQARLNGVVLQHGTIIIEDNLDELIDCLKLNQEEKNKYSKESKKKVTNLDYELGKKISLKNLENFMIKGFKDLFAKNNISFKEDVLSDYELELANKLYQTKYNTEKWQNLR